MQETPVRAANQGCKNDPVDQAPSHLTKLTELLCGVLGTEKLMRNEPRHHVDEEVDQMLCGFSHARYSHALLLRGVRLARSHTLVLCPIHPAGGRRHGWLGSRMSKRALKIVVDLHPLVHAIVSQAAPPRSLSPPILARASQGQ